MVDDNEDKRFKGYTQEVVSVIDCLQCDGFKYTMFPDKGCPAYSPLREKICAYYDIIDHDIQKLKDGKAKEMTFGCLEELLGWDKHGD